MNSLAIAEACQTRLASKIDLDGTKACLNSDPFLSDQNSDLFFFLFQLLVCHDELHQTAEWVRQHMSGKSSPSVGELLDAGLREPSA